MHVRGIGHAVRIVPARCARDDLEGFGVDRDHFIGAGRRRVHPIQLWHVQHAVDGADVGNGRRHLAPDGVEHDDGVVAQVRQEKKVVSLVEAGVVPARGSAR